MAKEQGHSYWGDILEARYEAMIARGKMPERWTVAVVVPDDATIFTVKVKNPSPSKDQPDNAVVHLGSVP
jgi:hypothetical protein